MLGIDSPPDRGATALAMCGSCGYLNWCEIRPGWGKHPPAALCKDCGGINITPEVVRKPVSRLKAISSTAIKAIVPRRPDFGKLIQELEKKSA